MFQTVFSSPLSKSAKIGEIGKSGTGSSYTLSINDGSQHNVPALKRKSTEFRFSILSSGFFLSTTISAILPTFRLPFSISRNSAAFTVAALNAERGESPLSTNSLNSHTRLCPGIMVGLPALLPATTLLLLLISSGNLSIKLALRFFISGVMSNRFT